MTGSKNELIVYNEFNNYLLYINLLFMKKKESMVTFGLIRLIVK
jgi:hypothetical protein